MTSLRALGVAAVVFIAGCGGARAGEVVDVPIRVVASVDAGAPDAAPKVALPPGANGPRDAVGMVGEAGRVVTGDPESVLLVNSAAIREHAWSESLRAALLGTLVGWDRFMPADLVHPTRDVDWMLLAGSLWLGSTQHNVVLAHHRVVNDAADSVFTTLTARLGGRPLETGVPGVKSFSARVDSSPRAFLLPKASVLAIVPEASASAVATQLVAAVVPERVRPGELLRVSYRERPRGLLALPVDVGAMRAWVTGSGQTALANVEADCADEAAATAAAEALMPALRHELGQHWMLRIFTNDLLERTTVWADGRTLRVKVDLREDDVRLVARFLCARRGDACEN